MKGFHPRISFWPQLARLGRLPEAHFEVQAGFAINPSFSNARVLAVSGDHPAVVVGRDRFIDGLRKAEVPEQ